MKNFKLPIVQNINMIAIPKAIKSIATVLSDMKNTKTLRFSLQRITTDNQIHTYEAELLKSGVQIMGEFVLPLCKNANEYKPIMIEFVKKGFTQKKIAKILNVSQSTVSRIINGK